MSDAIRAAKAALFTARQRLEVAKERLAQEAGCCADFAVLIDSNSLVWWQKEVSLAARAVAQCAARLAEMEHKSGVARHE